MMITSVLAKEVSIEVAIKSDSVPKDLSTEQWLKIVGYHQVLTNEFEEQKLDSVLFWDKYKAKSFSSEDELNFLRPYFQNASVTLIVTPDPKSITSDSIIKAQFTAIVENNLIKKIFDEIVLNLDDLRKKNFYILATIELDPSLTWEEMGVSKSELFTDSIIEAWKNMVKTKFSGFDLVTVLDKDFKEKNEAMNSKSVLLKWKSSFKKFSENTEKKVLSYSLQAQFLLENAKNDEVLASFDFPIQTREFSTTDKKALSSNLASLVYNLLLSQEAKMISSIEASKNQISSEMDVRLMSKSGMSEVYKVINTLQENFKEIGLTAQMKTFSFEGTLLQLRSTSPIEKMIEVLSKKSGEILLNEQNILVFNPSDKTFAIIQKQKNN